MLISVGVPDWVQVKKIYLQSDNIEPYLTWGAGQDGPQDVFAHRAQTLRRRKLKLGDLILIYVALKKLFWLPRLSGVTMVTSLSGSTRVFLKLSFYMFPYNKVVKSKLGVDIWKKHPKIPLHTKFQQNLSRGL